MNNFWKIERSIKGTVIFFEMFKQSGKRCSSSVLSSSYNFHFSDILKEKFGWKDNDHHQNDKWSPMWVAPLKKIETFSTMTDPREEGVSPSQLGGLFQRILEDCKVGQPAFSHFLGLFLRLIVGECIPFTICSQKRGMGTWDPISPPPILFTFHKRLSFSLSTVDAPLDSENNIKGKRYQCADGTPLLC